MTVEGEAKMNLSEAVGYLDQKRKTFAPGSQERARADCIWRTARFVDQTLDDFAQTSYLFDPPPEHAEIVAHFRVLGMDLDHDDD